MWISMFNLPQDDSPELLVGEFNFTRYYYEVCFDLIEERYGLFNRKVRTAKRYYITRQLKRETPEGKIETLMVRFWKLSENHYYFIECFLSKEGRCGGNVVLWDNPSDPTNLITFLKGRLDIPSHKDFVVFSSKDLE